MLRCYNIFIRLSIKSCRTLKTVSTKGHTSARCDFQFTVLFSKNLCLFESRN